MSDLVHCSQVGTGPLIEEDCGIDHNTASTVKRSHNSNQIGVDRIEETLLTPPNSPINNTTKHDLAVTTTTTTKKVLSTTSEYEASSTPVYEASKTYKYEPSTTSEYQPSKTSEYEPSKTHKYEAPRISEYEESKPPTPSHPPTPPQTPRTHLLHSPSASHSPTHQLPPSDLFPPTPATTPKQTSPHATTTSTTTTTNRHHDEELPYLKLNPCLQCHLLNLRCVFPSPPNLPSPHQPNPCTRCLDTHRPCILRRPLHPLTPTTLPTRHQNEGYLATSAYGSVCTEELLSTVTKLREQAREGWRWALPAVETCRAEVWRRRWAVRMEDGEAGGQGQGQEGKRRMGMGRVLGLGIALDG